MLMLIFHVGDHCYSCSCDWIVEIIPKVLLKQLPQSPDFMVGLLNYAGESIPVVDLSCLMLNHPSQNFMSTRIVVLKNPFNDEKINSLGVIVEEIVEVVEVENELFHDSGLKIESLPFLNGIYNRGDVSIHQIKVDVLFDFLSQRLTHT